MRRIANVVVLAAMVVLLTTTVAWAQVTPYSQDFEGLALPADPVVPIGDGWLFFVNVFDTGCGYAYTYNGDAPNGGGGISAVVAGQGGSGQEAQQLSIYSDYNNGDHGCGNTIEVNVYQQQAVTAADIGTNISFTFDAKMDNLAGNSTANAFIKMFDDVWGPLGDVAIDMTNIPVTWDTYSINMVIPAGTATMQFGFQSTAKDWEGSGIFYDNVNQPVPVELMSFSVE